jgi:hypothetical protein
MIYKRISKYCNFVFISSFQTAGKANKNVERKLFSPIVNEGCYLPDHNQHQNS